MPRRTHAAVAGKHEARKPGTDSQSASGSGDGKELSPEDLEREQGTAYKWIALSNTTLGVLMVTINA